jgi:hypothetical protein
MLTSVLATTAATARAACDIPKLAPYHARMSTGSARLRQNAFVRPPGLPTVRGPGDRQARSY